MSKNSLKIALAGRYATALLSLATAEKKSEALAGDLLALKRMLASSADLVRVTKSRILNPEDIEKALGLLFSEAKFDPLTIQFVRVVSENRRIEILPEIIESFFKLLDEKENRVNAEVITAVKMAPEEKEKLGKILTKISGKTVRITEKENPKILGGFKVKMAPYMLDASLAGKLEKLRISLEKQSG